MAVWVSLSLLLISTQMCLGQFHFKPKLKFHPYETQPQDRSQSCENHAQELDALLESLIDVIKGNADLSQHPHLYNIIENYLHRGKPTIYANRPDQYVYDNIVKESEYYSPYASRPLLKQKFVSDNFVEESGEDDFPPTNEVVQQIFKDIKILFRRKSKKRIPVGEIEDILLHNLRPFIIFPIVKPCRQENVDNMLNFVRSAYLRFIETPCYDNIARNGNTDKNDEDTRKLQESLREYIWQKKTQNRLPKSKSCKQRAFDYFLESIKIIVQLFIKNYDCHPEDDYNAPPVDEFDNIFTKNTYRTPRNYYRDTLVFPPFRTDSEARSKNKKPIFLDVNDFGPVNFNDRKDGGLNSLYTENGKVTVLDPIRDENVNTVHLNDVGYGDLFYPSLSNPNINRNNKIPSAKDSVLIGPVRDNEDDLRNKINTVHLNDGGYGDSHYPYYATEFNRNVKDNKDYTRIPNLGDFYRLIDGSNGIGKKQNNNNDLYSNFNKQQRNKESNSDNFHYLADTLFSTKNTLLDAQKHDVRQDSTNILNPNGILLDLDDFKNSNNQFTAFGSLINRPSVELPSYDKSTNKTADVEVVYVVRHPRVLLYNPQFVVKQRMAYETYLKNLQEIFHAKHFGPDNEVQLLKVLKRGTNGEIIPLYQSKEKYEPLLLKDVILVNKLVKEEAQVIKPENPFPTAKSQTEKPSEIEEVTGANNVTLREADAKETSQPLNKVVVNAKATAGVRNENQSLKNAYEETPNFADGTRALNQAPLTQLKEKKQVYYYDTPSYDNIVNTYKSNMEGEHALK